MVKKVTKLKRSYSKYVPSLVLLENMKQVIMFLLSCALAVNCIVVAKDLYKDCQIAIVGGGRS